MSVKAKATPATTIVTMKVADLFPAPYNPRRIEPDAKAGLAKSIDRFGLVQPIVWNKRSGLVVGGHQRLDVLRDKGIVETAVVVVDLAPIEERALNVALNSGAMAGEFTDALQDLLAEIEAADESLFADLRFTDLLTEIETAPAAFPEFDEGIETEHTCPRCKYRWSGTA